MNYMNYHHYELSLIFFAQAQLFLHIFSQGFALPVQKVDAKNLD